MPWLGEPPLLLILCFEVKVSKAHNIGVQFPKNHCCLQAMCAGDCPLLKGDFFFSIFFFRHKASNILPGARVLFIIVLDSVAQHRSSLNISITFYTNILR